MPLLNRLFSNSRQLLGRNVLQNTRGEHVMAAPPENKIPKGELYAMYFVLTASILAIPSWIVYHIPDYQQENRNQYTGK